MRFGVRIGWLRTAAISSLVALTASAETADVAATGGVLASKQRLAAVSRRSHLQQGREASQHATLLRREGSRRDRQPDVHFGNDGGDDDDDFIDKTEEPPEQGDDGTDDSSDNSGDKEAAKAVPIPGTDPKAEHPATPNMQPDAPSLLKIRQTPNEPSKEFNTITNDNSSTSKESDTTGAGSPTESSSSERSTSSGQTASQSSSSSPTGSSPVTSNEDGGRASEEAPITVIDKTDEDDGVNQADEPDPVGDSESMKQAKLQGMPVDSPDGQPTDGSQQIIPEFHDEKKNHEAFDPDVEQPPPPGVSPSLLELQQVRNDSNASGNTTDNTSNGSNATNDTANTSNDSNVSGAGLLGLNHTLNRSHASDPAVAVCISGLFRGLKQNLSQNIRTMLLDGLQEPADVVVAGPPYPNMSIEQTTQGLEALKPLAIRMHEEPRVEELWSLAYETMPAEAFSVLETWGDSGGATAFGPSFGNGYGIYQWYWRNQCLEMIEEQEKVRGRPYDRVVVTRYDYKWLAPHPPLKFLKKETAWLPDGMGETGINDHHAVLSRGMADVFMGVYRKLLTGEISSLLKTPKVEISWRNAEVVLMNLVDKYNISSKHFAPSAAVVGCPGNGDFHCVFARCREAGLEEYRSCDEAKAALHTAKRFNESAGVYTQQLVDQIW